MRVLGIIPARAGSKGVPGKNIRPLCGKPLMAYSIESALSSKRLTRTILSTEDEKIARIGEEYGISVPFLRPATMAMDDSPTFPVVRHALETLAAAGERYDAVCLLQPTSPLRRAADIDNCIELLEKTGADSVVSVLRVPDHFNPKWVYWRSDDGKMAISTGEIEPVSRRQDLPEAFHRDGSVYVSRTEAVLVRDSLYGERIYGYEIPEEFSSNIDTPDDWTQVEKRIAQLGVPASSSVGGNGI